MNVVRKHLCELKGGKLGAVLAHTNLITLISSDVPGNEVSTIGSGVTVGDLSKFIDAKSILEHYELWEKIPLSIQTHLQLGVEGVIAENPKPNDSIFNNHEVKIIHSAENLAAQIAEYFKAQGFDTYIAPKAYSDNVRSIAKIISSKAISVLSKNYPVNKPAALVFYGESYVEVKGKGKGGRNQELALACAISLEGQHDVTLISLGTDGIDGSHRCCWCYYRLIYNVKGSKKEIKSRRIFNT